MKQEPVPVVSVNNRPWKGKSPEGNWLIRKPEYYGCTMAFDRKVLEWSLPFPQRLPLHDNWIGLIGETLGKAKFVDNAMIFYHIHGNAASHIKNTLYYKIAYRIRFYFQISKRILKYKLKLKI